MKTLLESLFTQISDIRPKILSENERNKLFLDCGGFNISINLFLNANIENDKNYNDDNYDIIIVRNINSEINFRKKIVFEKTIGYLFTVGSLNGEIEFEKYEDAYAHAATKNIFRYNFPDNCFNTNLELTEREYNFHELFYSERFALVVLNKSLIDELNISKEVIKLNLIKCGFIPITEYFHKEFSSLNVSEYENINIKNISTDILSYLNSFNLIFELSHIQNDPFSKFITLYQVIELLISHLFKHLLSMQNFSILDTDSAFRFKEKLENITKEKYRINKLFFSYTSNIPSKLFKDCAELTNLLLDKVKPEYEKDTNGDMKIDEKGILIKKPRTDEWPNAIYELRNYAVHSQNLLHEKYYEELLTVTNLFQQCCIRLIRHFDLPK